MKQEELKDKLTRYKDMVYRIAYTYLHSTADAEDISQETFLKLYLREQPFPDAESEKAWLIRVTLNACCNLKKSFWQRQRSEMPEQMPDSMTSASVEESKLYHAVFSLPEKYRVVILLYYYEDYSVREISAITGRKESTIQTQLERGRKKLKKQLEQQGGFYYGEKHISEHDGAYQNVRSL
ncbi:MAG: RNA polymerase sigma factor [Ruminococcus sp.]|nr:RNA polymerase sigma factor [Ruminococcus sp.]